MESHRVPPPLTALRASIAALAVVGLLALTAGCSGIRRPSARSSGEVTGTPGSVAVGSSTQTISVGGQQRTYHLYRPSSLSASDPVALVVVLHGGFGSGSQAESAYGWDAKADSQHFLVAYPDGLDRAWAVGGGCCGAPARSGVDDVAFITQMVAAIARQVPIDPTRVYATGMSNGALLSYRLACDTTIFAAIGPVSGTLLGSCSAPAPVSVIHVHGTADHNVPYNGGEGDGVAKINGPAVPALNATWRNVDQCSAPSVTTAGPLTTSLATCPGGRAVELITVAGGGHEWPGGVRANDGPSDLDATDAIWQFFAGHPRAAT